MYLKAVVPDKVTIRIHAHTHPVYTSENIHINILFNLYKYLYTKAI